MWSASGRSQELPRPLGVRPTALMPTLSLVAATRAEAALQVVGGDGGVLLMEERDCLPEIAKGV